MRNFVVQIDSLNRRNQELLAENQEVKQQYKQVEAEKHQLSQDKEKLERTGATGGHVGSARHR